MSRKITIIGAGSVGATIAYTLANGDIASEIVMIDINKQKVEGEVMDIVQGTSFREQISIITGDYEDAKGSDIVIITSGIARKPGQTRLELAQTNVNIIKSIAPQIAATAPDALYIIVSNPVDIMTYAFIKFSGLPERQIIGSGTVLDTVRLRCGIAEHFDVAQKNVHTYVLGEHGDTSFIAWSCSRVSAIHVDDYPNAMKSIGRHVEPIDREAMMDYVRKSGSKIIENKGATYYAVSMSVNQLCKQLVAGADSMATISAMMHGEYGIEDVCLSTLSLIGPNGHCGKVHLELTEEEVAQLRHSADALKAVISQLEF